MNIAIAVTLIACPRNRNQVLGKSGSYLIISLRSPLSQWGETYYLANACELTARSKALGIISSTDAGIESYERNPHGTIRLTATPTHSVSLFRSFPKVSSLAQKSVVQNIGGSHFTWFRVPLRKSSEDVTSEFEIKSNKRPRTFGRSHAAGVLVSSALDALWNPSTECLRMYNNTPWRPSVDGQHMTRKSWMTRCRFPEYSQLSCRGAAHFSSRSETER